MRLFEEMQLLAKLLWTFVAVAVSRNLFVWQVCLCNEAWCINRIIRLTSYEFLLLWLPAILHFTNRNDCFILLVHIAMCNKVCPVVTDGLYVCVCWKHWWALLKLLNQSTWRFGCGLEEVQGTRYSLGTLGHPTGKGTFGKHALAYPDLPTVDILSILNVVR